MSNRVFKIVGRHRTTHPTWTRGGKRGTQAKKRVYTSLKDFERYAAETGLRYHRWCQWDVEAYEQIDSEWVEIPDWLVSELEKESKK